METSQPEAPARKLRWFQYSLRSLLLVMLLASIGMSWVAVRMQRARRQKDAVEEITNLGGEVMYDYEVQANRRFPLAQPPGPAWLRSLLGEDFFATVVHAYPTASVTDANLEHLKTLTQLRLLVIEGGQITDAGLEHLKGLTGLRVLSISGTQVTDAGLVHLTGLTQLRTLCVNEPRVTDAGFVHLEGLTELQVLELPATQITDAGMEHIKGLTQLRELSLGGTQVTDAGLEHLKGLTQLQKLFLSNTKVTDDGVKRLQQALPKCLIER
jgi:hypothetical protein